MRKLFLFLFLDLLILNLISATEFGYNTIEDPNALFGEVNFDGGWLNGGCTIEGGNLSCQRVNVFNITSLNVTKQNLTILEFLNIKGDFMVDEGDTFFVDSSSSFVGIRTTTPSRVLHVRGGGSQNSEIYIGRYSHADFYLDADGASADSRIWFQQDGVNKGKIHYDHADAVESMFFSTNGETTRMTIDGTGQVGIGTTTPTFKFEVHDQNSIAFSIEDSTAGRTRVYGDPFYFDGRLRAISTGSATEPRYGFETSGTTGIYSGGSNIISFTNNGVHSMSIIADGNVGIGTTTPQNTLNILGDLNQTNGNTTLQKLVIDSIGIGESPLSALSFINIATASHDDRGLDFSNSGQSGNDYAIYIDTETWWRDNSVLKTNQLVSGTHLNINAANNRDIKLNMFAGGELHMDGGNVGIGTSAPVEQLHVAGNIAINDSDKMFFGDAQDVSQTMDGSFFNITDEIGSIKMFFKGFLQYVFDKDINQTDGNATINLVYGGGYIGEVNDTTIVISGADSYVIMGLANANVSGTFSNGIVFNGTSFITQIGGIYKIDYGISASAGNGDEVHGSIGINNNVSFNHGCHSSRDSGPASAIGNFGTTCYVQTVAGDGINWLIENDADTDNINVQDASLTIVRVGN